ncbi:hypothetical protein SAMN04488542_12044 [Fontibacillus panacisegetis]|uniref:Butirosin biosynthesis protein H, N-terminal n=1 Tax=Fontibacillus panacisegetis TaxID=670482 RepID=A0A1G7PYJ0_9BACL|nr:hypothetical protein [Fontibacillus panacisegetis]SDF91324.1 hypothetical protein SAMN04488542_12044 [Fontibacillus panacisegetis]
MLLKEVTHPAAPFANCFGSYFISCCNFFRPSLTEDMILFLSSCNLKFFSLDYYYINQKFSGNPWGWKPLRICNSNGVPLFDEESAFYECIDFMRNTLGVHTEIKAYGEKTIVEAILEFLSLGRLPIVFIDDYYNSNSEKYLQKHNPHGILVIGAISEFQKFRVLDMDVEKAYEISFDEVVRFIPTTYSNFLSASFLSLYAGDPPVTVDYKGFYKQYLSKEKNIYKEIELLIQDMEHHFSKSGNIDYFAKGYHFTILYNIVPMARLRLHLINRVVKNDEERILSEKVFQDWISLSNLIINSVKSSDFAPTVIGMARSILDEETKLERQIRERGGI